MALGLPMRGSYCSGLERSETWVLPDDRLWFFQPVTAQAFQVDGFPNLTPKHAGVRVEEYSELFGHLPADPSLAR